MRKPLKPTSIKFSKEEIRYLKRAASAQKHHHLSKVVKALVQREMATA